MPIRDISDIVNRRRGSGNAQMPTNEFSPAPLRERHDLLISAHINSTKKNIRLASRRIQQYASAKPQPDPNVITAFTYVFVLNRLADHCKFLTPNYIKNDSMNALVQGSRRVYL